MVRSTIIFAVAVASLTLLLAVDRTHHGHARDHRAHTQHALHHLQHLQAVLDTGGAEPMQALFPEGYVFTHALTGLAWVQLGLSVDADHPLRQTARHAALNALDAVRSPQGTAPFPPHADPPYGVFHAGWSTQLQAGALLLQPPSERHATEVADLRASCDAIAHAFDGMSGPWLSSYRGMAWQADNVVAISAVARCDRLLGGYGHTVQRWVTLAKADADPELHTIGHAVAWGDRAPRGTSTALTLHFLHSVDPEWSAHHYRTFQREFVVQRAGLPAIQEYRDGRQTWGDVDAGPLPFGVSFSATVVGAGAARLHGDDPLADAIFGLGEAVAVPMPTRHGSTWAFGVLPLGEAFVVWSQTARPWMQDPLPVTPTPLPWWWRWWELPALLAGLAGLVWCDRRLTQSHASNR